MVTSVGHPAMTELLCVPFRVASTQYGKQGQEHRSEEMHTDISVTLQRSKSKMSGKTQKKGLNQD